MEKLETQYPDNPQVLLAEADLNIRIGNRGAGFAALNKAAMLEPGDEDILERQHDALISQQPFVSGGYNFRKTKEAYENFGRFDGQVTLAPSISASIALENDHLTTRIPLAYVNGTSANFSGDRQRGTVTLSKLFNNGNEASALFFGSDNTAGAGGRYVWQDQRGSTTLKGNLNQPDWDYVQTVVEDGTKDNIRLERKQIFSSHVKATLGGGFNNYNLNHESDVARSTAWDLNIGYTHPVSFSGNARQDLILGAYYTVDAEYFSNVDSRTLGGTTFMPLPVKSYEIHAINVSASKDFSSALHVEGYGGYAVDRLGDNGPLFGAVLEYSPIKSLGIDLHASRTMLGGAINNEREDQMGLNVKWRW